MTDWKQITARIRRARTGKDPAGQLSALFSKTRDAMVAFELARYFESVSNNDDAGKWYLTAAERFRRADWKTKAQESATRLGATVAAEIPPYPTKSETSSASSPVDKSEEAAESLPTSDVVPAEDAPGAAQSEVVSSTSSSVSSTRVTTPAARRPRGRGRRGGREHQRPTRAPQSTSASAEIAPAAPEQRSSSEERTPSLPTMRSLESMAESSSPSLRGRSGDPGLSSRLSQLEMNFRRLWPAPHQR